MELKIDPEFQAAIQPLSPEELAQLESNIKAHGCRDPLVTWNDFIVDGHHRYEICQRLDIPFQTVSMDFPDRAAAKVWMLHNQLGRRNLNDYQRSEIALQLEELLKGQAKARQLSALKQNAATEDTTAVTVPENLPERYNERGETRNVVAKTAGVSGRTIDKVKAIKDDAIPVIRDMARAGSMSIHAASRIADLPEETQEEIAEEINDGAKPTEALKKHVHIAQNSGDFEWYTPSNIIESARLVMGSIDCDPASCPVANVTVRADEFFTKEDDGLSKKWHGNVWLNPPYGNGLISQFADAVVEKYQSGEYRQICIIVNNATETQWFKTLSDIATAFCFPTGRVQFTRPEAIKGSPLQGQTIIYIGNNVSEFATEFKQIGLCVGPL